MFNKKLKTQIKDLKTKYDEVISKNSNLYLENQTLKEEVQKHKKSLEIEHEDCMRWKKEAENLGSELKDAVSFIEKKGYSVGMADTKELSYSFSGESTANANLKKEVKALNSKLIASEQFENDLKNRLAELQEENYNLKDELARRPFAPAKKKTSKK